MEHHHNGIPSSSALVLMAGRHQACKKPKPLIPKGSFWNKWRKRILGKLVNPGWPETGH